MSELNKETRCPFCGMEMDVVAGLKDEAGNQRTFYRCETQECPIRINTVTLESDEIAEAWCFKEMDHIRAEMTGKALDIAALVGSRALAINEVKALERRIGAAKTVFVEMHSATLSDDISRSAIRFEELVQRELDRDQPPADLHCSLCCAQFETEAALMNHGSCRAWYEAQI